MAIQRAYSPTTKTKIETKTQTTKVIDTEKEIDIKANPLYHIYADNPDPEVRKQKIVQGLLDTDIEKAEEFRQKVQEFRAYLHQRRHKDSRKIVNLTSTTAMAELQKTYQEFDKDMHEFDKTIDPIVRSLQAIFEIQEAGITFDALDSIRNQRSSESEIENFRNQKTREIVEIENKIKFLERENIEQSNNKSFFGFGGLKTEAINTIELNNRKIELNKEKLNSIRNEIANYKPPTAWDNNPELEKYAPQIQELKKLLDLSAPEHEERSKYLIQVSNQFMDTAEQRTKAIGFELDERGKQLNRLETSCNNNSLMMAVIADATNEARVKSKEKAKEFEPKEDDDNLTKIKKTQEKVKFDKYVKTLDNLTVDSSADMSDLTTQGIRISQMIEANEEKQNSLEILSTRGIAGMSDRLATVLEGVNSAAIGEAAKMAKATMERFQSNTSELARNGVLANAINVGDKVDDLTKAIEDLSAYKHTMEEASTIRKDLMSKLAEEVAKIKSITGEVQESFGESQAINMDNVTVQKSTNQPKFVETDEDDLFAK